jgi:hypothetical protein
VFGFLLAALAAEAAAAVNRQARGCGGPIPALELVLCSAKPLEIYQACFVNAVRFAAVFRQLVPAERAEVIRISVRFPSRTGSRLEGSRTESHAVVAFTFAGRNYLWDHALGVFNAPAGDIALPDYVRAAERAFQQRAFDGANTPRATLMRLGPAPVPPKTEAEVRTALQQLFSHLPPAVPVYRVDARLTDGRTIEGAAILFDQYFGLYLPDRGTLSSARVDRQRLEIDDPSALVRTAIADNDRTRILDLQVSRAGYSAAGAGRVERQCC